MTIFLDTLKTNVSSMPIAIPAQRRNYNVKVYSMDSFPGRSSPLASSIYCKVKEVSGDLITGQIIKTPPTQKPYRKGDMLLFTRDKVQDIHDN